MTGTLAIIQARMSSSRLPGKVLLDICGKSMLERVLDRVSLAKQIDHILVATTIDLSDDSLLEWCERQGVDCFRGSMLDVLDRFYQAALLHKPQLISRITADCPVIDPGLIDETVQACRENGADFAATRLPPPFHRTYPIGLDVEVSTFSALERAWREAVNPAEREHVFPYLYDQPGRFNLKILNHDPDFGSHRWTVDTAEDLELVRKIYKHFLPRMDFTWEEILALVQASPELTRINAQTPHKSYLDVDERGGKS
jgi:spore coat polysaccharide biosynthesis protein SpsF